MPSSDRSLRLTLLGGTPLAGAFLFLGAPDVAEVMASAGLPLLIADREHAAADLSGALHELRAIRSVSDAFVMARARDGSPGAIKPLLDAGFDGVMVADVRSAAQARAIAEAARYAPLGRRGAQFTVSRAAGYGAEEDHAVRANDALLVAVMIESRAGLEAIPEIAAVPGIDLLFLGPLDLTTDYGTFGDLTSPELADALHRAETAIRSSGKMLGGACLPGETAQDLFARGHALVSATSDVGLLREAANRAVQAIQP